MDHFISAVMARKSLMLSCLLLGLKAFSNASSNEQFLCGSEGEATMEFENGLISCLSTCPTIGLDCNCTKEEHCKHMGAACVEGHCDCFTLGQVPSRDGRVCLPLSGDGEICDQNAVCGRTSEFDKLSCNFTS